MRMAAKRFTENESTAVATFPLNYDCVFEVFLRLGFKECMSLAEAYGGLQQIADRIYKRKFNKLTLDFEQPIDRILYHVGPTVKSLTLILKSLPSYKKSDLIKIVDTCEQLQCLTLKGYNSKNVTIDSFDHTATSDPFVHTSTENLEVLTLNMCHVAKDEDFFEAYKNLKSVNFNWCQNVEAIAIQKCFKNNQGIRSFTYESQFIFAPRLLQLLPNLERLSLRYNGKYMKLNTLSKLQSLRHLTLVCDRLAENVNDVLADLAKTKILKELVLIDIDLDEHTFEHIKQLNNLQLLAITTNDCTFPASDDLPKKLKALKLGGFYIDDYDIVSTVKQLEHLEDIHFKNCFVAAEDFWVNDFDTMAKFIIDELTNYTHRRLNVAITSERENEVNINYSIYISDDSYFKHNFLQPFRRHCGQSAVCGSLIMWKI